MNAEGDHRHPHAKHADTAQPPEGAGSSSDDQVGRPQEVEQQRDGTQARGGSGARRPWWDWAGIGKALLASLAPLSAFATVAYAIVAAFQLSAMNGQIGVMQGQLDQMTAAQRPWVLASELTIERVDVLPDIAAIMASTNYKVTNFGQSPAIDVFVTTALFIEGVDVIDKSAIRALCKPHPIGSELFLYFYRCVMAPGKVEEVFGFPIQNGVFARETRSLEKRGITKVGANFVLGGCITYGFLGSDTLHETGFAIRVQDARVRVVGHITEFDSVEIGKRGAVESQKFLLAPDASLDFAN